MKTIKFSKNDINLDIKFDEERKTVWMSQEEIATLFSKSRSRVAHIIKEIQHNNPEFARICAENAQIGYSQEPIEIKGKTNKTTLINLDTIREIGYKINPSFTNEFVDWCNKELNKLNNQIIPIESNIIRFEQDNISLDVKISPEQDTVWLSQKDMATLFGVTTDNIGLHIINIIRSGELDKDSISEESSVIGVNGARYKITLYNLDLIIAIGYRVNSYRGVLFRRWATRVLKEYSIKGYSINDSRLKIIENNYIYLKDDVDKVKNRVREIEDKLSLGINKEVIFYQGEVFDGYDFLCGLVNQANKSIIIIDPYVDEITLSILKNKKEKVDVTIITTNKMKISDIDIETYNKQYGSITIMKRNTFHDRFIILDKESLYHLGSSLNRIGHNISTVIKMEDKTFLNYLKKTLSAVN